jgi:uncharacterized protein YaeQ
MLSSAPALHFRIALSHVNRGIDRVRNVIVERDRLESAEHLILRVLAFCLFFDDELRFGPGLGARGAADLWARDATGKPTIWIDCGVADADELRKMVQHNRGVAVHVLFNEAARRDAFMEQMTELKRRPPELDAIGIWTVDGALVGELAASDDLRQRWSVTIVEDHLYVETDGRTVDCALERVSAPAPERR